MTRDRCPVPIRRWRATGRLQPARPRPGGRVLRGTMEMYRLQAIDTLTDEELVQMVRSDPSRAALGLEALFERFYPRVARWCLKLCQDRDEAADVAQEVFMKVQQRLDSFRGDSRFSTWLYSVTRRVVIDHGVAARRQARVAGTGGAPPEAADTAPHVDEHLSREQVLEQLRDTMQRRLEPMEARVVYLHYVDGLSLPAITELLEFDNRSGAKAYLVAGMRKLRRHFGPWLARQDDRHGSGHGHNARGEINR